jgi:hypothetical protein
VDNRIKRKAAASRAEADAAGSTAEKEEVKKVKEKKGAADKAGLLARSASVTRRRSCLKPRKPSPLPKRW